MTYRWVEHTGELELEIDASTERGVFEDGFEAMRELLASDRTDGSPARQVALAARDRATLLADWLAELAFLAESEGLVPERLGSLELDAERARLTATVEGSRGEPPHLVKGATYHRLSFEPTDGGWHATVVLDV
jgi:SHS2 domain-containing protein